MKNSELIRILWGISTISCSLGLIRMLSIYKRLSIAFQLISVCMHEMIINKGRVQYETETPSPGEDIKSNE